MNPDLVRELDREGSAILQLLDDLPPGSPRDMTGHLDGKKAIQARIAKLMKRWREAGAGTAAPRASDLSGGVVKSARQCPRGSLVRDAR